MEALKTIVEEINSLMDQIKADNEKNINGNKAAGRRARKNSVILGKKLSEFRKISVDVNR